MFGLFGKKKTQESAPAASPATQDRAADVPPVQAEVSGVGGQSEVVVDLRTPEADFSDLTTDEAVKEAATEGRVEPFLLIGEMFGGDNGGPNRLFGPIGVLAAKHDLDQEIAAAIDAGQQVSLSADIGYDDGDSRIPRSVSYDLGGLGRRVLQLW